jgi:predicted nucleic acid-binding Zn finger protein
MTIAQPRTVPNSNTRELRALELYRTRGHEIHQTAEDLYLVPSCTGRGFYSVDYREETCDCPDFTHRRENCKHILAVGVHVAKRRHQRPHACNDGWVSMEVEVVDPETGAETVEEALYLCRRCASEASR